MVANHVVDGLLLPVTVADHPALELCNTLAGWGQPGPRDYLASFDHLAVLAHETGLVDRRTSRSWRREAAEHPRVARKVLGEAVAFRQSLYDVLTARPVPSQSADAVTAAVREAMRTLDLAVDLAPADLAPADGVGTRWHVGATAGLRGPLHLFALEAFRLLDTVGADEIGRCPGEGCGWLFLNRDGRRRWCIMAVCGNRAKARRFAARQRQLKERTGPARAS